MSMKFEALLSRRARLELAVWALISVLLAVGLTWPTARHPFTTIPQDVYDPLLQTWQLAWGGYALLHQPLALFQANASFPEADTLAFSDSLLGYAPAALIGSGPEAAVFRYNLLYIFAYAFACFGGYCLIRQLGGTRGAAAITGVAFAYAPWRLAHGGHLNVLSTGGIVLALALLARGHGWSLRRGYRPGLVRARWILAGWVVAAWQITLGFGVGIPFSYVLLGCCAVSGLTWLWKRPPLSRRLVLPDLAGGVFFASVVMLMSRPYFAVLEEHDDARRSVGWLELFSPPFKGFFTASQESWLWGARNAATRALLFTPTEMAVLPGWTLMLVAGVGLFVSCWSLRARVLLALGVALSVWLAMGTAAPGGGRYGYLLLFNHVPGFDSSRTPGRLVLWTTVLLCILAAGALTRVRVRLPRPGRLRFRAPWFRRLRFWRAGLVRLASPVLTLVLLGAVVAEGVNRTPHPEVPQSPVAFSTLSSPVLVLPTDEMYDLRVLLWSTDGFGSVVNGSSGYNPPEQAALRSEMEDFPDDMTVDSLHALGVKTVVVVRDDVVGTAYERSLVRDITDLGITRTDYDDVVVFTL